MGKTMMAFVMKGIGKVGFMEKPIPEVGPNDALIKTTRALVCTSATMRSDRRRSAAWLEISS